MQNASWLRCLETNLSKARSDPCPQPHQEPRLSTASLQPGSSWGDADAAFVPTPHTFPREPARECRAAGTEANRQPRPLRFWLGGETHTGDVLRIFQLPTIPSAGQGENTNELGSVLSRAGSPQESWRRYPISNQDVFEENRSPKQY